MTFSWLHSEKALRWGLVIVLICLALLPLLPFICRWKAYGREVAVIYSVEDMKFFGTKVLEYHQEHGEWPQAETIEDLKTVVGATTLERRPRGGFLDFNPALDLHSCIYLKGKFQNPGDEVLIGRTQKYREKNKWFCRELVFHEDGHVSVNILSWDANES